MKRFFSKILILIAVIGSFGLTSCMKFKEIRPTSVSVVEVKPNSFRNFGIKLDLGVNNIAPQLKFSEILGTIYYKGEEMGKVTAEPFTLEARKESVYPIQLNLDLNSGLQALRLMRILENSSELDNVTLDLSTRARLKSGISKRLTFNGVSAAALASYVKPLLNADKQTKDVLSKIGL